MRLVPCSRAPPFWLYVVLDKAAPMLDVMHELVAEVLDEALHRQRSGVAQSADGAPGDVVGDVVEKIEIGHAPLSVLDAVHHAVEPARAFAARRALAARFLEIEVRQAL